jgi:hypothetical protein
MGIGVVYTPISPSKARLPIRLNWDQASFDPEFTSDPLESFEPAVRRVFARKPHDKAVMAQGEVRGLPPLA